MVQELIRFLAGILAFFQQEPSLADGAGTIGNHECAQHVLSEIDKVLPHHVAGFGLSGLSQIENTVIKLSFDESGEPVFEENITLASQAARKGLLNCRNLYAYTNHGPLSPNFIRIDAYKNQDLSYNFGIYNDEFYKDGKLRYFSSKRLKTDDPIFRKINSFFKELGECTKICTYETEIEPGQPAVGFNVFLITEENRTYEESGAIFKSKYEKILEFCRSQDKTRFPFLNACFRSTKERFGISVFNIRNNLVLVENLRKGTSNEWDGGTIYHLPGVLNDLVPKHLHRAFPPRKPDSDGCLN